MDEPIVFKDRFLPGVDLPSNRISSLKLLIMCCDCIMFTVHSLNFSVCCWSIS